MRACWQPSNRFPRPNCDRPLSVHATHSRRRSALSRRGDSMLGFLAAIVTAAVALVTSRLTRRDRFTQMGWMDAKWLAEHRDADLRGH